MTFFWRNDELFVKQGSTSNIDEVWTSFLMETKEPIEVKKNYLIFVKIMHIYCYIKYCMC